MSLLREFGLARRTWAALPSIPPRRRFGLGLWTSTAQRRGEKFQGPVVGRFGLRQLAHRWKRAEDNSGKSLGSGIWLQIVGLRKERGSGADAVATKEPQRTVELHYCKQYFNDGKSAVSKISICWTRSNQGATVSLLRRSGRVLCHVAQLPFPKNQHAH